MSEGEPTLSDRVNFLSDSRAYPDDGGTVERLETHMSWVFLTSERVYKLKKPVRFAYLDFSTLASREAMCRAEVALNKRLAPDVYLGVMPLVLAGDRLRVGGEGRIVDWLVVMRRLDSRHMLDQRIRDKRVTSRDFERLAGVLASFYAHGRRQLVAPSDWLRRWRRNVRLNDRALSDPRFGLAAPAVRRVDRALRLFMCRYAPLITRRASEGRVVEGHGDLRPEHIWLGDGIKVIDCLEFNADLRRVDPLQELAYLDLECRRLGALSGTGHLTVSVCRRLKDDAPEGLFVFYRCYVAALRARLSAAHVREASPRTPEKWLPLAKSYLAFAVADAVRLEKLVTAPASQQSRRLGGAAVSRRRAEAPRLRLQAVPSYAREHRGRGRRNP